MHHHRRRLRTYLTGSLAVGIAATLTGFALATPGSAAISAHDPLHGAAARQAVDSFRITQRSFFETQRSIHFDDAVALGFQCFDLVPILNRPEMLECVGHHKQEQAGKRNAELPHIPRAPRICGNVVNSAKFYADFALSRDNCVSIWQSRPRRIGSEHVTGRRGDALSGYRMETGCTTTDAACAWP